MAYLITPSHNPSHDGGIKYNCPTGGPAEPAVTAWIETKGNEFLFFGENQLHNRGVNNEKQ